MQISGGNHQRCCWGFMARQPSVEGNHHPQEDILGGPRGPRTLRNSQPHIDQRRIQTNQNNIENMEKSSITAKEFNSKIDTLSQSAMSALGFNLYRDELIDYLQDISTIALMRRNMMNILERMKYRLYYRKINKKKVEGILNIIEFKKNIHHPSQPPELFISEFNRLYRML